MSQAMCTRKTYFITIVQSQPNIQHPPFAGSETQCCPSTESRKRQDCIVCHYDPKPNIAQAQTRKRQDYIVKHTCNHANARLHCVPLQSIRNPILPSTHAITQTQDCHYEYGNMSPTPRVRTNRRLLLRWRSACIACRSCGLGNVIV